jgi:hypothetical protein
MASAIRERPSGDIADMGWAGALSRFLAGGMLLGFSVASIIPAARAIEVLVIELRNARGWPRRLGILFNRMERAGSVADLTTREIRQTFDERRNVILEGCRATKTNWRALSRN